MSYGERLEQAMNAASTDRKTLAVQLGISVQAVGQVVTGRTRALDAANHMRAATFLRCDPLWLATGEGQRVPKAAISWPFTRISPANWAALTPGLKDKIETFAEGVMAASPDQGTGTNG